MKSKIIIIIIIVGILICILAVFLLYHFRSSFVELKLLVRIESSENNRYNTEDQEITTPLHENELSWLFFDSPNHKVLTDINEETLMKDWGISFADLGVNFQKNNIIISFCREVKEMQFQIQEYPYQKTPFVKTILSKKYEPNAIYVYLIPKYEVAENPKAKTMTFIEE